MADFKLFWPLLSHNEGGYVSKEQAEAKHDSGGETYEGISRNNFPAWSGWALIDSYKPQATFPGILRRDHTLQDLVLKFFKTSFWDVLKADQVKNQSIANFLADWGVNAGSSVPVKHAQDVLGVNVDGKVGAATLAAINGADGPDFFTKMQGERKQFYLDVVENHPDDKGELDGWLKRNDSFSYTA